MECVLVGCYLALAEHVRVGWGGMAMCVWRWADSGWVLLATCACLSVLQKVQGGTARLNLFGGLQNSSLGRDAAHCPHHPPSLPGPHLVLQVRAGLGHLDPYFAKLADAMVAWIECWKKLNSSEKA